MNTLAYVISLISPDHLTVDKERGMERGDYAIGSKLFLLVSVVSQKYPEKASKLFIYLDIFHSAYKLHGGTVW